jgi:hypothetical protein
MEQHRVRDAFYHLAHEEHIPATLFIPLGDLAYDYGTEAELQQRFFVPYVARASVHIGRWVERSQVWIPLPCKANMPSLQSHACHPMLMLSPPTATFCDSGTPGLCITPPPGQSLGTMTS